MEGQCKEPVKLGTHRISVCFGAVRANNSIEIALRNQYGDPRITNLFFKPDRGLHLLPPILFGMLKSNLGSTLLLRSGFDYKSIDIIWRFYWLVLGYVCNIYISYT